MATSIIKRPAAGIDKSYLVVSNGISNDTSINPNNPPDGVAIGPTTVNFDGYPTELGGNSFLVISRCVYSGESLVFGSQLLLPFASDKIAVRYHNYGISNTWSPWRVI